MGLFHAIGAVFKFIWHGLDALRKVMHLLLLLFIFGLIAVAVSRDLPLLPREAALVLAPEGRIVEELTGRPFERAINEASGSAEPESRLKDLVDVLRAAKDDDRVKVVVLDLESLTGGGLPALQDVAAAIAAVRAAGKKVLAWSQYYDQRQYYLAAQADEVYVDPFGFVMLEGYGYYRSYFKGTLDRLGVNVHVFKVGSHKSAPDRWTRADMSPEDREEAKGWLGALWTDYKDDVARARGIEPEVVQAYADKAGASAREVAGDLAQLALNRGFVNGLKTREEFEALVMEFAGEDDDEHSYNAIDWHEYLTVLRSEEALHKQPNQNVGVIVASGEIFDGEQSPGTIGGDTLAEMLRDARYDDEIEAVVLRIDSPGGSMLASEVVRREVAALRESGKPVVASMGSVAASGGYYIAMEADRILASPATITGSIGVFALLPTFEKTLDKVGVTNDGFGTTAMADMERIDRGLNPELAVVLQASVENAYQRFITAVAKARKRKVEEIDGIAQGKVWSGADAKAAGLVDDFGDVDAAVREAAKLAKLKKGYGTRWLDRKTDWREALALRFEGASLAAAGSLGLAPRRLSLPADELLFAEARRLARLETLRGKPLYLCGCGAE